MTGVPRILPAVVVILGTCSVFGCSDRQKKQLPENSPRNSGKPSIDPFAHKHPIRFKELTGGSGIDFAYCNGEEAGHFSILESLGGGVALLDYDRDGQFDVFLPGGGSFQGQTIRGASGALFRQTRRVAFANVTAFARVGQPSLYSHGACVADYDCDGFPDLLITGYSGVVLYRNQGDGSFEEVTHEAQLIDSMWSSSAAWCDVNHDGHLDLFVVHYVDWSFERHPFCSGPEKGQREVCPPRSFEPLPDKLFLGRGDGSFEDASQQCGLRPDGKGLGVVAADIDLDGDTDVYVANDGDPNFLYINDGTGHFEEVGLQSGVALGESGHRDGSMGVDIGDFNLDGLLDIWVANFESESFALYRNEGRGNFRHASRVAGITAIGALYVGWGTAFVDLDRDGDEDLFSANGHVARYPRNASLRQLPILLENDEEHRFVSIGHGSNDYMAQPHMGRGAAIGDLDDDGDVDLVISHTNEPVSVLLNESSNQNHWLRLHLIGVATNRDALGATVRVKTAAGWQTRQRKGGSSYASTSDPRLFFGLGAETKVHTVEIHWPNGKVQQLKNVAADRELVVVEAIRE